MGRINALKKKMGIEDIFFWKGKERTLYIISFPKSVYLYLTADPKDMLSLPHLRFGPGADYMMFSKEEFAALVRDLVKYILNMPELSVKIRSDITCLDVPHGILAESKIIRHGKRLVMKLDPRAVKAWELEGVKNFKLVELKDGRFAIVPEGFKEARKDR